MSDYTWVMIPAFFAFISFLLFTFTITKSSRLIRKLRYKKINILANFILFIAGSINIYFVIYVLLLVRDLIERFNTL